MINASHTMLPKNTIHSRYGCKKDMRSDNPITGIISDTRLCLSRNLIELTIRWDLVIPTTAFGLRLNALMKCRLNIFGIAAYRVSPAFPAVLMNTFPVRLNREIRSAACLRLAGLWMGLRQDAVRGMDHPFFLAGHRWHWILSGLYGQTEKTGASPCSCRRVIF